MENNTKIQKLQNHFHSKYAGEDVVKVGEDNISVTSFFHWIFRRQSYGAHYDYDHDECVEEGICHNGMDCQAKSGIIIDVCEVIFSQLLVMSY